MPNVQMRRDRDGWGKLRSLECVYCYDRNMVHRTGLALAQPDAVRAADAMRSNEVWLSTHPVWVQEADILQVLDCSWPFNFVSNGILQKELGCQEYDKLLRQQGQFVCTTAMTVDDPPPRDGKPSPGWMLAAASLDFGALEVDVTGLPKKLSLWLQTMYAEYKKGQTRLERAIKVSSRVGARCSAELQKELAIYKDRLDKVEKSFLAARKLEELQATPLQVVLLGKRRCSSEDVQARKDNELKLQSVIDKCNFMHLRHIALRGSAATQGMRILMALRMQEIAQARRHHNVLAVNKFMAAIIAYCHVRAGTASGNSSMRRAQFSASASRGVKVQQCSLIHLVALMPEDLLRLCHVVFKYHGHTNQGLLRGAACAPVPLSGTLKMDMPMREVLCNDRMRDILRLPTFDSPLELPDRLVDVGNPAKRVYFCSSEGGFASRLDGKLTLEWDLKADSLRLLAVSCVERSVSAWPVGDV